MLAELDDLIAIGALPMDVTDDEPRATRATRLLELISDQVVGYLRYDDEAALRAASIWSATKGNALAAIVIEVASERLAQGAAPNVDQGFYSRIPTVMLRPYHKRAIDEIFGRPGNGYSSVEVERDPATSFLTGNGMWGRYDPYTKTSL